MSKTTDAIVIGAAVLGAFAAYITIKNNAGAVKNFLTVGQATPSEAPAANPISRTADAWARALTPNATPDATLGTMLYDWFHGGDTPSTGGPKLDPALAAIMST